MALAAVAALVRLLALGYNRLGPVIDRRRRDRDDQMFLHHYCGTGLLLRYRRINRRLPSSPRCKFCYVPFGGIGRLIGIKPSRMNPSFCAACFESAPLGGHETDVGVLFADGRGFTAWSKSHTPTDIASSLNRFYACATTSLMAHDAVIDKFVGDEVMALFITDISSLGTGMSDHMLAAARELVAAAHLSCSELPLGVGLHCGTAWVGNVGSGDVRDFTALGDVVNMAARLQSCAGPGQIVLSEEVRTRLTEPPSCDSADFTVKGNEGPLTAWVIDTTPAELAET